MALELVTCPRCSSTRVLPDHDWDGSFLSFWCVDCDHESIVPGDDWQFRALMHFLRALGVIAIIVILWGILT